MRKVSSCREASHEQAVASMRSVRGALRDWFCNRRRSPRENARQGTADCRLSWTGCYVGGYVGGAWDGRAEFTDQGQNGLGAAGSIANPPFMSYAGGAVAAELVPPHSWNDDLGASVIAGGLFGCNWQPVGSPFVLGIEGEVGYLHLRGEAFDPTTIISTQTTLDVLGSARIGDWYGMVTGRLGYSWNHTLLFVKGGVAFVPTKASVVDACQNTAAGCGNWLVSTRSGDGRDMDARRRTESAFAPNWSAKASICSSRSATMTNPDLRPCDNSLRGHAGRRTVLLQQ